MEYRVLPHGGEKISVIGMGASVIGARPEGEIIATVRAAAGCGAVALQDGADQAAVHPVRTG